MIMRSRPWSKRKIVDIFERRKNEPSAAGGLDGLAFAIGLHLMMEEVVPTKRWNAIDSAKH